MYDTRYSPENSKQWKFEKTILQHFPYYLNMRNKWFALIRDGNRTMKGLMLHRNRI